MKPRSSAANDRPEKVRRSGRAGAAASGPGEPVPYAPSDFIEEALAKPLTVPSSAYVGEGAAKPPIVARQEAFAFDIRSGQQRADAARWPYKLVTHKWNCAYCEADCSPAWRWDYVPALGLAPFLKPGDGFRLVGCCAACLSDLADCEQLCLGRRSEEVIGAVRAAACIDLDLDLDEPRLAGVEKMLAERGWRHACGCPACGGRRDLLEAERGKRNFVAKQLTQTK